MQPIAASEQASALKRAYGDKSEVVVAANIRQCRDTGRHEEADAWMAVRRALRQRSGASES